MEEFAFQEFEEIYNMLDGLSFDAFVSPELLETEKANYFLLDELLDSAKGTVQIIDYCCKKKLYSLAYVNLRQFCEYFMQYVFLSAFIIDYSKQSVILDKINRFKQSKSVQLWFDGLLYTQKEQDRKKVFSLSSYRKQICDFSKSAKMFFELIGNEWDNMIKKLNDHVHINGQKVAVLNLSRVRDGQNIEEKELIAFTQKVVCLLLSLLAVVNAKRFASSDYVDALEIEVQPQVGSQYWVAPIFSNFLQRECVKINPQLFSFIQDNNSCNMQF